MWVTKVLDFVFEPQVRLNISDPLKVRSIGVDTLVVLSLKSPYVSILCPNGNEPGLSLVSVVEDPSWNPEGDPLWNIEVDAELNRILVFGENSLFLAEHPEGGKIDHRVRYFVPLSGSVLTSGRIFLAEMPYFGRPPIIELNSGMSPVRRFGVTRTNSNERAASPPLNAILLATWSHSQVLAINRFSGECFTFDLDGRPRGSFSLLDRLELPGIERANDDPRLVLVQDIQSVGGHLGVLLVGMTVSGRRNAVALLLDADLDAEWMRLIDVSEGIPLSICFDASLESVFLVTQLKDGTELTKLRTRTEDTIGRD